VYAIDVVVCPGEDRCSGWGTDGVCDVAVVEEHALFGYSVQIGGMIDAGTVAADCLRRVVVPGPCQRKVVSQLTVSGEGAMGVEQMDKNICRRQGNMA